MGVSNISDLTTHLLDTPAFDSVCGALLKLSQLGLREKAGKDQLTPLGQRILSTPLAISEHEGMSLAYLCKGTRVRDSGGYVDRYASIRPRRRHCDHEIESLARLDARFPCSD